jgi:uncharacterized membrane protein YqgA involved in biofilm formation
VCLSLLIASICMEAQIWTLISLLAATAVGTVFYLGNRIDSLGARMDARIDGLSARIDTLTDRVDGRGRHVASEIYGLATKLDDHLRHHAG